MAELHSLLKRLLRKQFGQQPLPPELVQLFETISLTFEHFEKDRTLLERTMILNSEELERANQNLNSLNDSLENKVDERTRSLAEALKRANAASEAKSHFLANVSHELRTPLTAIIGFSQILEKMVKTDNLSTKYQEFIHLVLSNSFQLVSLIDTILDLSRMEVGKTHLSYESIDFLNLLKESESNYTLLANQKKISFKTSFGQDMPKKIKTDRAKLKQVLNNLISNALKFTSPGKTVELGVKKNDNLLLFYVKDEGIGIPPDKLDLIFNPFEQVDPSINRTYGGAGLGLAISRQIVLLLGGEISVESTVGVGSTFFVLLPLLEVDEKESVDNTHSFHLGSIQFSNDSQVLIIEDNPTNQHLLLEMLDSVNISKIVVADDGQAGLRKLAEFLPDIIISDLHMPVMDGLTCLKHVREHPDPKVAQLPVVICTADILSEKKKIAQELGVKDYLIKPIQMNELIAVLVKYLKYNTESQPLTDNVSNKTEILPKDEHDEHIIQKLFTIKEIPIFQATDILGKLDEIKLLCQKFEKDYNHVLASLKDAVYEGDEDKITTILNELRPEKIPQ